MKGGSAFKDSGAKVFYGVGAITGVQNRPLAVPAADNRARAEVRKLYEVYNLQNFSAGQTPRSGARRQRVKTNRSIRPTTRSRRRPSRA